MWVVSVRDFISGNKANSGLLPSFACLSSAFQGNLNERFTNLYEKLITLVQSLSRIWLFVTPWAAACQASLSFTMSCSLLKFMSIESVMPSNHLILYRPLPLLPSVFLSIRVFFQWVALCIRWSEYWSFSISPSSEYLGLISFRKSLALSSTSAFSGKPSSAL